MLTLQVIELWEDTSAAAQTLPTAQRHYVHVLFNGRELAVPPATTAAGEALTLERFEEAILSQYALSEGERDARCAVPSWWWGFVSDVVVGRA